MSASPPDTRSTPIDGIIISSRHRAFREEDIPALAKSIAVAGLLNPITVAEVDGGHRLVAGLHRLEAVRSLGWSEIPAAILRVDELETALGELVGAP